ncbi:toxin HicA [Leifsonia sp. RAF41]|uniref:toxin HicA n=1 Tax=Leifsonia sp. RAF41 TaxID=3233056 RepID=UPI003F9884FA
MPQIAKLLLRMRQNPADIRFRELAKVCVAYFGEPRQSGSSHMVFKTPWSGDPRVNIQNDHGRAKRYQVCQVLLAIDRWESERR